ncbi:MAG TPA: phage integrase N-terminal SAM-like domain-containing protein, partial [Anaerolineales bacterium]|nr:phage integrase N-terminal SAM-like domain-containing protein [Anaerolineales bacterium]
MPQTQNDQWTITKTGAHLESWLEAFLVDRKAQNLAAGTLYFYTKKLALFIQFCQGQAISTVEHITPDSIRRYLFWLEETRHNPGGIHDCYRALKTFLLWYEDEAEPENWRNPIRRVRAPRLALEPLAPVLLEAVSRLLSTCEADFHGLRDRAIILTL